MNTPYEAVIAIIIGTIFTLLPLYASSFNPQYFTEFFFIGVGEFFLFIAGILIIVEYIRFRNNFRPHSYRKIYYILIVSLVLYLVGIITWIETTQNDFIFNLTYASVLPILISTGYYFQQLFATVENEDGTYNTFILPEEQSMSDKFKRNYQILYIIPIILSIVAIISVFSLPLVSASLKNLNTTQNFYSTYILYYYNWGSSIWGVYAIVLSSLVGGVLMLIERKNVLGHIFRPFLQIGALLSLAAGVFAILSVLAIEYTYQKYFFHTLGIGLVIAFLCVLLSSSIAINLYLPINSMGEKE